MRSNLGVAAFIAVVASAVRVGAIDAAPSLYGGVGRRTKADTECSRSMCRAPQSRGSSQLSRLRPKCGGALVG